MSKTNIAEIATKVYQLLEGLDAGDRDKVIRASQVLLGEEGTPTIPAGAGQAPAVQMPEVKGGQAKSALDYFNEKKPENKGEEFAVAAHFREKFKNSSTHVRDDLQQIIADARRNFDSRNFKRDIENARKKGLFNRSSGEKGSIVLAYYGQQYVDALPDREAIKKLGKPRKGKKGGKKASKKAK